MKLSKREKFLIFVLIVAVIGYFGFKYIPFEKVFSLDELKAEHSQKKQAYNTIVDYCSNWLFWIQICTG